MAMTTLPPRPLELFAGRGAHVASCCWRKCFREYGLLMRRKLSAEASIKTADNPLLCKSEQRRPASWRALWSCSSGVLSYEPPFRQCCLGRL
eukprot:3063241-Amphidinium_carterae.1